MHHTPDTLTADMILRTPMSGMPDTSLMTPDDAAAALVAYVCEYHNSNAVTDAMLAAADADIVDMIARKLLNTEWGHEIINAAAHECVYSPWFRDVSWVTYTGTERIEWLRFASDDLHPDDTAHGSPQVRYAIPDARIARSIAQIINSHGTDYARDIRDAVAEHDASMIDADAADAIVQLAAFGELVYG